MVACQLNVKTGGDMEIRMRIQRKSWIGKRTNSAILEQGPGPDCFVFFFLRDIVSCLLLFGVGGVYSQVTEIN